MAMTHVALAKIGVEKLDCMLSETAEAQAQSWKVSAGEGVT
jgi:hypothetical protein